MHKFSYNKFNELENPTVVLSTKYHKHLGILTNIDISTIECNFNMASAQEISFDLYRYKDDIEELLWDSVVDFKYIFVPEHQEYYSIEVQIDENNNTVKHITGTSACEFELSNRILYNFECNTESDILQDDYVVTKFYNPENPKGSLLHRVLADKCPDYTIAHVDSSLKDIQRTFSANGQDIYSFLTGTIAEEVECLFVFNSVSRTISAYDLKFVCNSCGHRGDLSVTCPECGSSEYYGKYGETTNIFISSENFAEQITRSGDTDNVFNCLKISGGDDVIDTALMYINPNGTQYLYNFNQETLADMPDELIQKIIQYNELYNSLKEPYTQESKRYFDAVDEKGYLEHSMMPEVTTPTTDAQTEADNLPSAFSNFGDISVTNITSLSSTSANLAVQGMAKVLVDPRYEVKVSGNISSLIDGTSRNWTGTATITNIGNDEDTATTASFTVKIIGNNYEKYLYQRILKQLDRDDSVFFTIFDIDNINTFKEELTKYSKSLLEGFYNSYETCLNVLIENGVTDENSVFYDVNLYNEMYSPYKQRLDLIQSEINIRDLQIAEQDEIITQSKNAIASYHNRLDFKKYIGNDLWIIFSHYRKESEYSNENYVSDGLDNAGVIDKAKELFEVCEKEIKKASQLQYSLTCNLNNLLNTKEFSNYKEKIQIGNWITLKIDEKLYYLRLINIKVNYGSLDKITISFSTAVVINSTINDTKSIFDQMQNIASSYDTVKHQAEQGDNANINVNNWLTDGLNSALVTIKNNINEEVIYDNNGILLRSFDDILDEYSPKQSRLTSNIFAFTDDNWRTAKLGIGEHNYVKYNTITKTFQQDTGYGLSAEFVTAGYINGSQIIGGDIYSQNYSSTNKTGTVLHLNDGTFSFGGEKLVYDGNTFTLKDVVMRWDSINTPEISDIDGLSTTLYNIESNISELDDRIQTFSQNTDPSSDWTTNEEKEKHISDIWFNTNNSKTYIYTKSGNTYSWVETNDSTLMSLATGKSTIFVSKPNTPDVTGYYYHAGDLWILQSDVTLNNTAYKSKTVLTALNSRATGFVESDWVPATTKAATDFASDTIITPGEKIQLKYTMMNITQEYTEISNQAAKYTMDISSLTTAYNALKSYTDTFLANMTINSENINATTYSTKFSNYYNARKTAEGNLETARINYSDGNLNDFITNTYEPYVTDAQLQLDAKISSYYQSSAPYENKTNVTSTSELDSLVGDLWYETDTGKTYSYQKTAGTTSGKYNYTWTFEDIPNAVFDLIDGKKNIYISAPITDTDNDGYLYHSGDMWVISSNDQNSTNTTVKNLASQYTVKTILLSSVDRKTTFTASDWSPTTTESAEQALSDISDMANDSKLTPVEKIQIKRRLAEIDDEKILYDARKTAYSSYSTVVTTWTAYNTKYTDLKNQSSNWNLDSSTTTDISNNTFTKYFTQYYTAKEALDSALENASKQYAEDKASDVQNNLDSFQSKVQGALTGSPSTEIGTDYIISPKIGGGYLYIKNANDGRSVTIDPKQSYSSNGYIFKVTDSNGNITIGADSSGNANFSGNITATSGKIGDWTISGSLLIGQTSTGSYSGYKTVLQPPGSGYWGIAVGVPSGDTSYGNAPFRVAHDGSFVATNATVTGNITASTLTANQSGNIGGWNISSSGLSSQISYDYNNVSPQYTDNDLIRVHNIVNGSIRPTASDIDRYDFDGDGVISVQDAVTCSNIKNGNTKLSGFVTISPNNLKYNIVLGTTSDSEIAPGSLTTIGIRSVCSPRAVFNNALINNGLEVDGGFTVFGGDGITVRQRNSYGATANTLQIRAVMESTGDYSYAVYQTYDNGSFHAFQNHNGIYNDIMAGGFVQQSSKLVKTNINNMSDGEADKILNINVVTFDYKENFGGLKNQRGVIAEDVLKTIPSAVSVPLNYDESKFDESKGTLQPILSVDYSKFVPYLIKKVQMQEEEINKLKEKIGGI